MLVKSKPGFLVDILAIAKEVHMRVKITSKFDAPPAKVFQKLQEPSTLARVAAPFLSFRLVGQECLPEKWETGRDYVFRLFLFKLIPIGEHMIRIIKVDWNKYELESNESGKIARVWNHLIVLKEGIDGNTIYTDEVEIEAGIRTFPVWLFASLFYRHWQRKWRRIARGL